MAAGSQVIIDVQGITIKTNRQAVFRAGEHRFENGEKILIDMPFLPVLQTDGCYILEFDVRHKVDDELLGGAVFSLIDSKGNVQTGKVPKDGIVRVRSARKEENYTIIIHKYDAEVVEQDQ